MFTLGIVSDGYLSKQKKTLSIATSGYLDASTSISPIRGRGGDVGSHILTPKKTPLTEYIARQKRLQIEDDEILNILKMFLQCQ